MFPCSLDSMWIYYRKIDLYDDADRRLTSIARLRAQSLLRHRQEIYEILYKHQSILWQDLYWNPYKRHTKDSPESGHDLWVWHDETIPTISQNTHHHRREGAYAPGASTLPEQRRIGQQAGVRGGGERSNIKLYAGSNFGGGGGGGIGRGSPGLGRLASQLRAQWFSTVVPTNHELRRYSRFPPIVHTREGGGAAAPTIPAQEVQ